MEREIRYRPHFVKPGTTRVISSRSCLARFVVTGAGGSRARLRAFDAAAATGMNATLAERIAIWAPAYDSREALGVALGFATGLTVSLSGTGAVATVYIREIT